MKITKEMVEYWLGSSSTLDEAIDTITEIANNNYSVDTLRKDILTTNEVANEDL